MSTAFPSPLPKPVTTPARRSRYTRHHRRCLACPDDTTDAHPREWLPDPDGPQAGDGRPFVLCFGGTAELIGESVSQLGGSSPSGHGKT